MSNSNFISSLFEHPGTIRLEEPIWEKRDAPTAVHFALCEKLWALVQSYLNCKSCRLTGRRSLMNSKETTCRTLF